MRTTIVSRHAPETLVSLCVLLAAAFLTGCAPKKLPAYGAANELTIVTNLSTRDETVQLLKSTFARSLVSEDEDTLYVPEVLSAGEFARYGRRYDASRNLVILVDITKHDGLTKKVQGLLGTKVFKQIEEGPAEYFVHSNVWALAQTLVIIAGAGKGNLAGAIKTRGNRLYAEMDSVITERTKDALYGGEGILGEGEQTSAGTGLASKYGWSLRMPAGFRSTRLDTVGAGTLLRFKTEEPTRLVFVYWIPYQGTELPDPKKCLEIRAELVWIVYDQDVMDFTRTVTRDVVFEGRKSVKIEGVWQNKKYVTRGPFFSYCFLSGNRFYMIDAVVYAPGTRKGALFKQLEAIITTFKG
jgi:hypothetical protein